MATGTPGGPGLTPEQEKAIQDAEAQLQANEGRVAEAVVTGSPDQLKPETIQKIMDALTSGGSFLDSFYQVKRVLGDLTDLTPEQKKELEEKVKVIVFGALERHKNGLERRIQAFETEIERKKERIRKPIFDAARQTVEQLIRSRRMTPVDARDARKAAEEAAQIAYDQEWADEEAKPEHQKIVDRIAALQNVLDQLENPDVYIQDLLIPKKPKPKPKPAAKPGTTPGAKKEAWEITDAPKVVDIKTPADIRKAREKWSQVENEYGDKPKPGDTLVWKNKKVDPELTPADIIEFEEFQRYLDEEENLAQEVKDQISAVVIQVKDPTGKVKSSRKLEEEVETEAKAVLESLLAGHPEPEQQALLFQALGVENKREAFRKIQNILLLTQVSEARKGDKGVYVESGKSVPLNAFLAKHGANAEVMVAKSHEVMLKLQEMFGEALGLNDGEFRNVLIEIIKSKGTKNAPGGVAAINADKAAEIYRYFLIFKDPNINEKEILSLLIAFKDNPPAVFDLINTTKGWETVSGRKTGKSVLEDFCVDGVIYNELKKGLGMERLAFNRFIIKIAPNFEYIRSKIESNAAVKLDEVNAGLTGDQVLTAGDFEKFKQLMTIPLWVDKVGQAFKYALYLNDEGGREVPEMIKQQGADLVKNVDVVVVNVEEKLRRIANRLADERLDRELKEAGFESWKDLWKVWRVAGKWWKRSAMEGYREKYRGEFMKRLKEDPRFRTELMLVDRDKLLTGADGSGVLPAEGTRADLNGELDMIAERFGMAWTSGDRESYLMEGSGETLEEVENLAVQQRVRDLCNEYLQGGMSDDQFRIRARREIVPMVGSTPPDEAMVAFLEERGTTRPPEERTGLLDRLRQHQAGLICLDLDNLRLRLGRGRAVNVDVKTQVKGVNGVFDNSVRSWIESMQKGGFLGKFINPTTTAIVGYGVANVATQLISGRAIRYGTVAASIALTPILAPALAPAAAALGGAALGAGLFAAMRNNKDVLWLKAQKERREAMNFRPDQGQTSGIEKRMEDKNVLYEKAPVEQLINAIRSNIGAGAGSVDGLRLSLGRAIALNEVSERNRLDLIQYSDEQQIEGGRLGLMRAIAEGKVELRNLMGDAVTANEALQREVSSQVARVNTAVSTRETSFRKFKAWENLKNATVAAFIGAGVAGIGWGISSQYPFAASYETNTVLTPTGKVTLGTPEFDALMKKEGINPADIKFVGGKLDPASIAILNKAGIGIPEQEIIPATPDVKNLSHILNGQEMTQQQVIDELNKLKIIDPTTNVPVTFGPSHFDPKGHMSPTTVAYLKAQGVDLFEITRKQIVYPPVTASTGGGAGTPGGITFPFAQPKVVDTSGIYFAGADVPGHGGVVDTGVSHGVGTVPVGPRIPSLPGDGFESIDKIHFNGHIPKPRLDELRLLWDGSPQVDADGNCHFKIGDMLKKGIQHTKLPENVTLPDSPKAMNVALEMDGPDGRHYWKFFDVNEHGQAKIPEQYFDKDHLGYVRKGGDTLPGLRTKAMAVGFFDSKGTFQVLSSVKGSHDYEPPLPPEPPAPPPAPPRPLPPVIPPPAPPPLPPVVPPAPIETETVSFKVDQTTVTKGTDANIKLGLSKHTITTEEYAAATPPVSGSPMPHLEHKKKNTPPPAAPPTGAPPAGGGGAASP